MKLFSLLKMSKKTTLTSLFLMLLSLNILAIKQPNAPRGNQIFGFVAQGFEPVLDAFKNGLMLDESSGAALCIFYKGIKIVDIWGGYANKKNNQLWDENTLVLHFSATKGIAALCIAKLHSEAKIDYREKVANYWPEFALHGKENITVSQLLSHQSGLCLLDEKLTLTQISTRELLLPHLENTKPLWTPGENSGYSAGLLGFYMSELVRRTDTKQRSIGQYFQEEIAQPLNAEFYIGLPDSVNSNRLAHIKLAHPIKRLFTMGKLPEGLRKSILNPGSLFMKSVMQIKGYNVNNRESLKIEEPSGNGIGTARAVALIYSTIAMGGNDLKIKTETISLLSNDALLPKNGSIDKVMGIALYYRNGFMKNGKDAIPYNNNQCFGFGGASGAMSFADPLNKIGYCYAPNNQGYDFPDSRELEIQKALYDCIQKVRNQQK